eukprot:6588668-Pyramimonas_sp.AAC.2
MAKFEELTDMPVQGNGAREAPEVEPPQEDGRLPTSYEESEADLEPHSMEVWYAEPQDERELLEATPTDELYIAAPAQMTSSSS